MCQPHLLYNFLASLILTADDDTHQKTLTKLMSNIALEEKDEEETLFIMKNGPPRG